MNVVMYIGVYLAPHYINTLICFCRYCIIYVFQGVGLTGNIIADSVQYVINVALTVPAIIYIDKWGRFGEWGTVDGSRV